MTEAEQKISESVSQITAMLPGIAEVVKRNRVRQKLDAIVWILDQPTQIQPSSGKGSPPFVPADHEGGKPTPQPPPDHGPWANGAGARMWRELHTMENPTPEKLMAFGNAIPCRSCKEKWFVSVEKHPPDFGPGWFAWTVDLHNEVNELLHKDKFGIEQARAMYKI